MGRRILGCRRSTTNEAVLGELGWWTMEERRELLMIRLWGKIIRMNDNRLIKRMYERRRKYEKGSDTWCKRVKGILEKIGLG